MSGLIYAVKGYSGDPPVDRPERQTILDKAGLGLVRDLPFSVVEGQLHGEPVYGFNPQSNRNGNAEQAKPAIDEENQVWADFGTYEIGYWTIGGYLTSRPQPKDLAREDQYWSRMIDLADGQLWRVPVVPIDLPQIYSMRPDGEAYMAVQARYDDIMKLSGQYWDINQVVEPLRVKVREVEDKSDTARSRLKDLSEKTEQSDKHRTEIDKTLQSIKVFDTTISDLYGEIEEKYPDAVQRCEDCIAVLSKNYYLRGQEVALLELLDNQSCSRIVFNSFLDGKAIEEQKRAEKNGRATRSGTGST